MEPGCLLVCCVDCCAGRVLARSSVLSTVISSRLFFSGADGVHRVAGWGSMGCRSARLGAPAPGMVRGLAHDPTDGRGLAPSIDDRMTA